MKKEMNEKIRLLWDSARILIGLSDSARSKLATFKWTASRQWGMLFRMTFISAIGIGGHYWLDAQPIGDVPFSQLTLNQLFRNVFDFLLITGCFCWFINFPKQKKKPESPYDNPYVVWGTFGVLFLFLTALIGSVITIFYIAWV